MSIDLDLDRRVAGLYRSVLSAVEEYNSSIAEGSTGRIPILSVDQKAYDLLAALNRAVNKS